MLAIVAFIAVQLLCIPVSAVPTAEDPAAAVFECLAIHSVRYIGPFSPTWSDFISPYNLRLAYTPIVVVIPGTIPEIQDAVRCAGSLGIKVQARSGGHSYASYSLGGSNGSMIVDLEVFQNIVLDNGMMTPSSNPTPTDKLILTTTQTQTLPWLVAVHVWVILPSPSTTEASELCPMAPAQESVLVVMQPTVVSARAPVHGDLPWTPLSAWTWSLQTAASYMPAQLHTRSYTLPLEVQQTASALSLRFISKPSLLLRN